MTIEATQESALLGFNQGFNCCLCSENITSGKGKHHQKKLNGSSYALQKNKLQECALEINTNLSDIKQLKGDVVLCYQCLQKLNKLIKLEKEVKVIKQELMNCLHKLELASRSRKRESIGKQPVEMHKKTRPDTSTIMDANKDSQTVC